MEQFITSKSISNRKDYTDIKRTVFVYGFYFGIDKITLQTICKYYDNADLDITYKFATNDQELNATNFKRKDVLDSEGEPVYDTIQEQELIEGIPQFNEDESPKMIDVHVKKTIGLYDYFKEMANQPVPLIAMFQSIVSDNDLLGTYDV